MAYKEILNVSVEREVKTWIVNWCEKNNTKLSVGTNYLLKKIIKQIDSEQKMVICKCGAEYSSKVGKCPLCGEVSG